MQAGLHLHLTVERHAAAFKDVAGTAILYEKWNPLMGLQHYSEDEFKKQAQRVLVRKPVKLADIHFISKFV